MTWCFGFNYENGRKRTKKKKKRRSRRGGRRKTVVKFGLCDESGPPSNPRILMSIFSNQSEPILLHWNLMKKSSLLPFVSIRFLIAVALFFVVYVGPTGPSFINHWTNLHSPLFSSPSFHLTLSLSIILGLKNRPMFLTEPCPLNLISKTEIERGRGCPSVSPPRPCRQSQLFVICRDLGYVWSSLVTSTIYLTGWIGRGSNSCTVAKINLSFTLWNVPSHRFPISKFPLPPLPPLLLGIYT